MPLKSPTNFLQDVFAYTIRTATGSAYTAYAENWDSSYYFLQRFYNSPKIMPPIRIYDGSDGECQVGCGIVGLLDVIGRSAMNKIIF